MACSQVFRGKVSSSACRQSVRRSAQLTVRCSAVKPDGSSPQAADATVSRRELAGVFAALSIGGLVAAQPANAFLGIGENGDVFDYEKETAAVLGNVKTIIDMPKDAEGKEETVKELRKEINSWVAKYRREPKFAGRPSYGNTYSILNALAGHFNSFGPTANIPKKRLDRIRKELDDAERLLSRGR